MVHRWCAEYGHARALSVYLRVTQPAHSLRGHSPTRAREDWIRLGCSTLYSAFGGYADDLFTCIDIVTVDTREDYGKQKERRRRP